MVDIGSEIKNNKSSAYKESMCEHVYLPSLFISSFNGQSSHAPSPFFRHLHDKTESYLKQKE